MEIQLATSFKLKYISFKGQVYVPFEAFINLNSNICDCLEKEVKIMAYIAYSCVPNCVFVEPQQTE